MKLTIPLLLIGAALLLGQPAFGQTLIPLIEFGSTWKYLDNGSNQGTAWRAPDYDDAAWMAGPGQLGFGDNDESTTITRGVGESSFITFYFRHSFVVADPSSILGLTASMVRDDGAVVYLNGTEVWRENMPGGTITFNTLADIAISGSDAENNPVSNLLNPALLVPGTNVIAVEMHQVGLDSSDISFDFELAGEVGTGPPVIRAQPLDQSVFEDGTALFNVQAVGMGPLVYQWQFEGVDLPGATRSTLTLEMVTTNDAGSYRVNVRNSLGSTVSDEVTLTVLDAGSGVLDDFDPGIDPLQWSAFSDLVLSTNSGGSVSGNHSLWFGGNEEPRFATTRPLNTTAGGNITFWIRISGGDGFPWENTDLPNEGVEFEYSVDGGSTWQLIAEYRTAEFRNWTLQTFPIPGGALSEGTLFRWAQDIHSGAVNDHWAIDDVSISTAPSAPTILVEPQDQLAISGGTVTFSVVVSGTQPLRYQWDHNGLDIPDATNSLLRVAGIAESDQGTYRVRIENALGMTVSRKSTLTLIEVQGESFRIASLSTNNARGIQHAQLTGDHRGGIAASGSHFFVTGDTSTARFGLNNLNDSASLGTRLDALCSDLRTATVYSLANGNNPIQAGGTPVNALIELNGVTGQPNGNRIDLSEAIPMANPGPFGIYSGFGRIVLHNGANAYNIDLPTGVVTDLGAMAIPLHQGCENWAHWGVAEFFGGAVHLVQVQDIITISRTRVPDGAVQTLASFPNYGLGNMCSLTVSVADGQWYFQHEGFSELFVDFSADEVTGYADAVLNFSQPNTPPDIVMHPRDTYGLVGRPFHLQAVVFGGEPISFQWYASGQPLAGATHADLEFTPASTAESGPYVLVASNAFGVVTSQVAQVILNDIRGVAGVIRDNPGQFFTGKYDLTLIKAAFEPRDVTDTLASADFSGMDLLIIEQQAGAISATLQRRLDDIQDWVSRGGKLIINDGIFTFTDPAPNPILIGSQGTIFQYEPATDVNFIAPHGTALAAGPFGTLNNSSLDGTGFIFGGYAIRSTLPVGSRLLISNGPNPDQVVAFAYGMGEGFVFYSTFPLTYLFGNTGPVFDNFENIFAPNLYDYMAGLQPSGPAVIGAPPQDTLALEGTSLRLNLTASGTPPLHYQWLFNDTPITGATNIGLQIENVLANDAGAYRVVVSNPINTVTSQVAQVTIIGAGVPFRIASLTTNQSGVIDHEDLTGDDRGPIAVGAGRVLISGATSTAAYDRDDLSRGVTYGSVYEGLVSDLNSEIVYAFGQGDTPLDFSGNLTTLLEIDEDTGARNGNRIDLSHPIPMGGVSLGSVGFFSGFDRIMLHTGTRLYHISLPSGLVVDLGPVPTPIHTFPAFVGYWGIAEFFDGDFYLVTVSDSQTITRTRIRDGFTETVASFQNLGDMASMTVSIRSGRWYFHHEASSQFGGVDETLGYADATFEVDIPPSPPMIRSQPSDRTVFTGANVNLRVNVTGSMPFTFQWFRDGTAIPGAIGASLVLTNVASSDGGSYQVVIRNALGTATSSPAILTVSQGPAPFQIVSLRTSNSMVQDHNNVTGDDRGGIAASTGTVFYTGDSATARLNADNLSGGTSLGVRYDALFTDLATETIWTLASGANPIANNGGTVTVSTLIRLDSTTGALTFNRVTLDRTINLNQNNNVGIFSGFGWVLIHDGSQVFGIQISSGHVEPLGTVGSLNHQFCENWAYWGIAEFFAGTFHLVYVQNQINIVRTRVSDGTTTTLLGTPELTNLSDMCSITAIPSRGRWYFHHEGGSQFGGNAETVGYADAVFAFNRPPQLSTLGIRFGAEDQTLGPVAFTVFDDDTPGSNLVFSVTSTNHVVAPPENILIEGSGTNFTVTVLPVPDAFGNSIITITATDREGNSGSTELGAAFRAINDPPLFNLASAELSVLDLAGPQSVPNWATNISPGPANEANQTLTFSVSTDNNALFTQAPTLSTNGTLTYTPAPGAAGSALVTVTLMDNGGLLFGGRNTSDPQTFTLIVMPSNMPPTANDLATATIEDAPLLGTVSGSDPDGDALTFSLLNAPDVGMVQLQPSGAFTYTPPLHFNGPVVFTFKANDGRADSLPATVSLNVLPANDRPSFTSPLDLTLPEDAGPQSFPAWATAISPGPPDEAEQELHFMVLVSNPSLFATPPAVSPEGTLSFTPADDAHGSTTLTVILMDDGGTDNGGANASAPRKIQFLLTSVNDAPSFTPGGDVDVNEDAGPQLLPAWASNLATGPDNENGQTLDFSLSNDNPSLFGVAPSITPEGTLAFSPAEDQYGSATLTVVLADNGGTSEGGLDRTAPVHFLITVHPVNDAPSFTPGGNVSVREDAGPQSRPNWASNLSRGPANESGQDLSFEVSHDNPPLFSAPPALTSNGTLTFTPAEDQSGSATLTVVLTDNGGTERGGINRSAPLTFTLRVGGENDAPTAVSFGASVDEDTALELELRGSDIDGDEVTYIIVSGPSHGSLSPGTGSGRWTYQPAENYFGADQVTYKVSDGELESGDAVVSLEIKPVNDAPVGQAEAGPVSALVDDPTFPLILAPDNRTAMVTLRATGSADVEGDALTYYWLDPGTLLPFAEGEVVTYPFGLGLQEVVLMVDDGQDTGLATIRFEVITPGMGLELLIVEVGRSVLPRHRKQPLIASLKAAAASFDRDNWNSGGNQLEAFLNKLRAQVTKIDAALAERWERKARMVWDAVPSR